MSVGENIRRYRKSRGMTQVQLAEAVGLTEGPCAITRAASAPQARCRGLSRCARRFRQRPQGLRRRDRGRPHVAARAARGLRHCARSRRLGPLSEPQGSTRSQSRDGDRAVGREARSSRTARSTPPSTRTGKPRRSGSPHCAFNATESGRQAEAVSAARTCVC